MFCKSKSEARRLINQGGGYINGVRIEDPNQIIDYKDVIDGKILLRAGKKRFMLLRIVEEEYD